MPPAKEAALAVQWQGACPASAPRWCAVALAATRVMMAACRCSSEWQLAMVEPMAEAPPAKAAPMARVALAMFDPTARAAPAKAMAESAMVLAAGSAAVSSELGRGV